MPQVRYTRRADHDMDAIWEYIAKENRVAANSMLRAIAHKAELAASQPMMGTSRFELADHLRSVTEGHYVIFYRPVPDGIEIIRIIHDARDIDNAFT